jgi:hypothetical protein
VPICHTLQTLAYGVYHTFTSNVYFWYLGLIGNVFQLLNQRYKRGRNTTKLKIDPACYRELDFPIGKGNGGKEHVEIIGRVRVSYRFYSVGTVMVFTESSNSPFKLEDEC